ncbi:biopolymer transporter ExbD [Sulfitobacter sp. LCG007]
MRRRARARTEREPTVTLINVVFLMLIFFLVAGTIAPPLDPELNLVRTADLDGAEPAEALVLHPDGHLSWKGAPVDSVEAFLRARDDEMPDRVRIVPDRDAPAARLVEIGRELRAAGARDVVIVTERGLR